MLYPGEIEHRREQERRRDGIQVEDATWYRIRTLAEEYNLVDRLALGDVE